LRVVFENHQGFQKIAILFISGVVGIKTTAWLKYR